MCKMVNELNGPVHFCEISSWNTSSYPLVKLKSGGGGVYNLYTKHVCVQYI